MIETDNYIILENINEIVVGDHVKSRRWENWYKVIDVEISTNTFRLQALKSTISAEYTLYCSNWYKKISTSISDIET